jgi:type IV pilus assembly protein PilC
MAHFSYKARHSTGEIYKSERDASDRYELYRLLKSEGDEVITVEEGSARRSIFSMSFSMNMFKTVKMHDRIIFARNLSSMIQAGLPVSRALSVMERQATNKELKRILNVLQEEISKGKTINESMKLFPKVFSNLFVSMVRAGEESGTLADALKVVAIQMDRVYSLQRRIRGAMMYPAIIVFAMIIIAILMLTYIVPTLMKTFSELNVALPTSTRIILFISNLVREHGLIVFAVVVLVLSAIYMWSKRAQGKFVLHYLMLKIPIIGSIVKEVNAARTARTMSSLLSSGVDVVESIKITQDVIQNVHYKKVLEEAGEIIKKGAPIAKVFTDHPKLYPVFLGEMINVGEETGKVGEMLLGVAVFYEDDVEQKTKDMSTVIEPFLMIVIAAVVGFFAVAMISPMYSLVDVI